MKKLGKELPDQEGQSEGYKEATKIVQDQEMKEAESALKTVDNSSINAKAVARAIESESLNQVS